MSTALEQLQAHLRTRELTRTTVAVQLTVTETQDAASRRTGALAESITGESPTLADSRYVTRITAAAPYALYQDEGTGVYGPSGVRIFPTRAKALRFDWPAAGGVVFAKSVAGAPGRHYFHSPMAARWHENLLAAGGVQF